MFSDVSLAGLSFILSLSAVLLSIASPIISNWIGGHYRIKERRMELDADLCRRNAEFYDKHRAEVIERYICRVGSLSHLKNDGAYKDYGESLGEIYLYVDEDLWPIIDRIEASIVASRFESIREDLVVLCKELSHASVRDRSKPAV